ncbi:MAG: hypothetical protein ACOX1Y_13225 [Zhaonellaceae bacterium]|jgi:outer membrane murein-binding lipoprotein Lpp|nr:hypothetical protein [Clostridia bacterium]
MVKRVYCLTLFVLLISLLISGCSSDQEKIAKLEKQIAELQEQVNTLQTNYAKVNAENEALKVQLEEETGQGILGEEDVVITVIDKINIPANTDKWQFNDLVRLHISITNNTNKDIKGIKGVLHFKDMFGVSILRSQCDLTGYTIKAGETCVNEDMTLEINNFMDDHVKIYNTRYEDLIFEYKVQQIMFTDGTSRVNESSI